MDFIEIEAQTPFTEDVLEHKIMSMDRDKRLRVFTAAMKEFQKGYGKANTDVIVEQAGISKGLLFHYFGSKKGLFLYLMRYAIEAVSAQYAKAVVEGGDYIETIWNIARTAIDLVQRLPLVFWFMGQGALSMMEEFPEEMERDFGNPLDGLFEQAAHTMDRSLFREDIDIEKAVEIINWTVQGYNGRLAHQPWDAQVSEDRIQAIELDLRQYCDLLRKLFYRS